MDDTEVNNKNKGTPSKFKSTCSQVIANTTVNLSMFVYGTTIGFTTILLPALKNPDSEIKVTLEELTWISSVNFVVVPIGGFASGIYSEFLGRKLSLIFLMPLFIICWMIFYYAETASILFVSLIGTGLIGGLLEAPAVMYSAEICEPRLRGALGATGTVSLISGIFSQVLIGSAVYWRILVLINIAFPILCLLGLFLVPESPYWLASKERLEDAEKALAWLRGWTMPQNVKAEFINLCDSYKKPADLKQDDKINWLNWRLYARSSFYKPLAIVTLGFLLSAFNGQLPIQTFAIIIFENIKSPMDPYTAAIIASLLTLTGCITLICIIHTFGKRKLMFLSLIVSAIAFSISISAEYLIKYQNDYLLQLKWISTTMLMIVAFVSSLGIRTIPWILTGELFQSNIRSIASGIASSMFYFFSSIMNKIFLYMVNYLSMTGVFIFFAIINIIGFVLFYSTLPETEGKSLMEIQAIYEKTKTKSKKNYVPKEQTRF